MILYYREGQSVAQVADLLELTPDVVRQRLSRSRRRMRDTVAERLGRTLSRTAPGAAFTAAVLTGLNVAAPPVAASAAIGTAAKVGGASLAVKLAIGLGGIVVGASGGILGLLLGLRWDFRKADADERRQLRRFAATGVGLMLAVSVGFTLSGTSGTWIAPAVVYLTFVCGLWWMCFVWLPRITAPRLAADRAVDPEAAARQRQQARMGRLGFLGGALTGGAGVVAGLFMPGLLP